MFLAKQKGFALLEVLIAWVLLTVVILGITRLQLNNTRMTAAAYWRSAATVQADVLLQQLRVITDPTIWSETLEKWRRDTARRLPNGRGNYACQSNRCRVQVYWGHPSKNKVVLVE